jgi:chromosome segregation ATPase
MEEPGPENEFLDLNEEMKKTLQELEARGENLMHVHAEFLKLHRSFNNVHNSELRYIRRTEELETDTRKIRQQMLEMKEENDASNERKTRLQADIERTWKAVAESNARESKKKANISTLKLKIDILKTGLQNGSGWTKEQENTLIGLLSTQEDLQSNLGEKRTLLHQTRTSVGAITLALQNEDERKKKLYAKAQILDSRIVGVKTETKVQQQRKDNFDREMTIKKKKCESMAFVIKKNKNRIEEGKIEIREVEQRLDFAKRELGTYLKEYENILSITSRLTVKLQEQIKANEKVDVQLVALKSNSKEYARQSNVIKKELKTLQKMIGISGKRHDSYISKKEQTDSERLRLVSACDTVAADLVSQKFSYEKIRKQVDHLQRERDVVSKEVQSADDRTSKLIAFLRIQEGTQRNLESEISSYVVQARQLQDTILQVNKDVDRYNIVCRDKNKSYYSALERLRMKESAIIETNKRISNSMSRLKQQQNLYEQVRTDRNMYSKTLLEYQQEICQMKREFKMMNNRIEQLKEEIMTKDHNLVKEHFEHHKVQREKDVLRNDVNKTKKQITSSEQIIANQFLEITKLNKIINEAENERDRQKKEVRSVAGESELLGGQLTKRNAELNTLYMSIKLLRANLSRGENHYNETRSILMGLQRDQEVLQKELQDCKGEISNTDSLRKEALFVDQCLIQERMKIKFLSDELSRPINVHRWRKLESSDPDKWDLVQRVHHLQQQLIQKSDKAVKQDMFIQEKEKLYVELKNILGRQPGPEVAEQLQLYRSNLKEKQTQMNAMDSELVMYKAQVTALKNSIERINVSLKTQQDTYIKFMSK